MLLCFSVLLIVRQSEDLCQQNNIRATFFVCNSILRTVTKDSQRRAATTRLDAVWPVPGRRLVPLREHLAGWFNNQSSLRLRQGFVAKDRDYTTTDSYDKQGFTVSFNLRLRRRARQQGCGRVCGVCVCEVECSCRSKIRNS